MTRTRGVKMKVKMDGFHKLQDDLEKVIERDDSNSTTTNDSDDVKEEFKTFRERLIHVMQTNKFQIGIVIFVVLDCLLVIAELLIDLEVFEFEKTQNEGPTPTSYSDEEVSKVSEAELIAPKVLHYASLVILGGFLIEIGFRLYALRLDFFRHKLELFDALIVIVSFVLDVIYRDDDSAKSGTGLLIILRLWRVTRILNGIILSIKKQAEKKLDRERHLREACEKELSKYREYCMQQETEIEMLHGLLKKHGIKELEVCPQPTEVKKLSVVAEVNQVIEMSQTLDIEQEICQDEPEVT